MTIDTSYGSLSLPIHYATQLYTLYTTNSYVQHTLALFGLLTILTLLYHLLTFTFTTLLPSGQAQTYCHGIHGSWAVITGSSDGIGLAFAEELLSRGFNVLLHGRNAQKLSTLTKTLLTKYPNRKIDHIVADASSSTPSEAEDLLHEKILSIRKDTNAKFTILINNVGGQSVSPQYLPQHLTSPASTQTILNLNARFPLQLTTLLLPVLIEDSPSLILNVGSASTFIGTPYTAAYAGTKGFIGGWTQSLAYELEAEGLSDKVEVRCAVVANVISSRNAKEMGGITISSEECAKGCVARCGGKGKRVWIYPHWKHAFAINGLMCMPQWFIRRTMIGEMRERYEEEKKCR